MAKRKVKKRSKSKKPRYSVPRGETVINPETGERKIMAYKGRLVPESARSPKDKFMDQHKRDARLGIGRMKVTKVEHYGSSGRKREATVNIGTSRYIMDGDPARHISKRISDALNPDLRVHKVKTFAEMTPEERAEVIAKSTPPSQITRQGTRALWPPK